MTKPKADNQLELDLENQTQAEILRLLREIRENQMPPEGTLWKTEDIARYFQVHPRTASRMVTQPGFPKPVRPPSSSENLLPARYDPAEVKIYARRSRVSTRQQQQEKA